MREQFGQFGAELERNMLDRKIKEYRNKRNWLLREVHLCERKIIEIKKLINTIQRDYENNKLNYEEYIKLISNKHDGKTLTQWKEYREELREKLEKTKEHREIPAYLPFVLTIVLGLGLIIAGNAMQGLLNITGKTVEQVYNFGIPETTNVNETTTVTTTSSTIGFFMQPATTTTSSSSTLPHANLTLYLRNSTAQASFTGLYTNITILTNESFNITSKAPYPADVNMTLFVMNYQGINQSFNKSKSFLQNFTTFWTTGSFLINISWEGNLTFYQNSTAFWVDVNPTTTTSSSTSSSTLPHANLTLYLNSNLYQNITTTVNKSVNITSKTNYPADVNITFFLTNYQGVNASFNYSKSFLENFTNFWMPGNYLANVTHEGNLTMFGNSTAFYISVFGESYFPLYLKNSTSSAENLNKNITALTNESINITSSNIIPSTANITLYVQNYAGTQINYNVSKSFLQNFTTFWTNGSFLINISWEGSTLTPSTYYYGNSTSFYVDVNPTTTTSSSTSSTLPHANLTLYLRNSTAQASFTGLYTNITILTNESFNITSKAPYPADVNMTLFVMNYQGINQSFNKSKSFLQNFTTFWTTGSFLINISWEGNLTFYQNSTAFWVDVIATSTSTTSTTANGPPIILGLSQIGQQTISEQTQTFVILYYNVSDGNGASNINGSSAKAQFNQSNTYRTNTSCNSLGAVNSSTMQFACTLDIWYFDANTWGYNVSIFNNASLYAENVSNIFSIAQTKGMAMSPTALTFPTVSLGNSNKSASNNPITVNNSGNVNIPIGNMNITAYNLHGLTTTSEYISATNFTVNNTNSCNGSIGGIQLANNTKYILSQNFMNSGNVSNGGQTNTTLYFCLWNVPSSGISGQVYDTSASSAWEVRVF